MTTANVVTIGGGIVGSIVAYHLTAAGCAHVLVIERSTGKSMGGVRAQFSAPVNVPMSLYAIPFYASFYERLGHPAGYRPKRAWAGLYEMTPDHSGWRRRGCPGSFWRMASAGMVGCTRPRPGRFFRI